MDIELIIDTLLKEGILNIMFDDDEEETTDEEEEETPEEVEIGA